MSDALLEWLSYAEKGRVDNLPGELGGASGRRMTDSLAMLAHIETPSSLTWRVAPPCLAELPNGIAGQHASVLCGARTPGVLARLSVASESSFGTLEISEVERGLPSVVKVTCPTRSDLRRVATQAGIPFQDNAAFTLMACLPSIAAWPRHKTPMIAGRVLGVRRFSSEALQWVTATLEEATAAKSGFFRIQREYDWVSLVKLGSDQAATIDDRAGRMLAAAKVRALNWDQETLALRFPMQLVPPMPISRALALCTGRLPSFNRKTNQLVFGGVNLAMLRLTQDITGLRLL